MEKTVDARGLMCPQPLLMSKRELTKLEQGRIIVLVDNAVTAGNIVAWAEAEGFLAETERRGGDHAVTVDKN